MTENQKPKTRVATIAGTGSNALTMALAASLMSGIGGKKTSPEEKLEQAAKRQAQKDEDIRRAHILKNVCPTCSDKLTRGRKDKKNDYKRGWYCSDCEKTYFM